jgi:hypothetical protein
VEPPGGPEIATDETRAISSRAESPGGPKIAAGKTEAVP